MRVRAGFVFKMWAPKLMFFGGIFAVVVVGSISSSLIKRDKKECEEQIELAKNAAKIYFSLNNEVNSVSIQVLKENDYFNANKKVDRLNDDSTVTYDNNGYTFNGTCKES